MARTNSCRSPKSATHIDRAFGGPIRARPQRQTFERLGVSYQQVRKHEIGANRLSVARLCDLCRVLGLVSAELLTDPAPVAKPLDSVQREQRALARDMRHLTPQHRQAVMQFAGALGRQAPPELPGEA